MGTCGLDPSSCESSQTLGYYEHGIELPGFAVHGEVFG
jgi:hypothetical protein